MEGLTISAAVAMKLGNKHRVSRREVEQAFENRAGRLLKDQREQHRTDPPTLWFIAPSNKGRLLKVVYIQRGRAIELRTAYEPNEVERAIYAKHGGVAY
ncbi:MAG: ADP-ribosyl-(dinitrogen reductase) hydrolase [Betaproteobacteria bacterium]|nr:ADP-ribosyl-(dinitrogen reductase) hydrolase [Betaproteobacteria bacterium]